MKKNREPHGPTGIDAEIMSNEKGESDNVMDSSASFMQFKTHMGNMTVKLFSEILNNFFDMGCYIFIFTWASNYVAP